MQDGLVEGTNILQHAVSMCRAAVLTCPEEGCTILTTCNNVHSHSLNLVVSIPMCLQTILGSMGSSQTQLFSGFFYLVIGDMFLPGLGHHQAFSKNTDHLTAIS